MLSLGAHVFNTKWLTHDFDMRHSRNTYGTLAGEHQSTPVLQNQSEGLGSTSYSLSNAVHKLLHSADPAQPILLTYLSDGMHDSSPRTIRFSARAAAIFQADSEPPFRPPQTAYHA